MVDDEDDVYPEDGVASWFDEQPGERMLRKTNLRMGTADVYKQNKNQEEDMLTTERLKKGYQVSVVPGRGKRCSNRVQCNYGGTRG